MHPDDTINTSAVPSEPVEQAADTTTEAQPRQGFQRRTFLKAAALGTAAAVAMRGGSMGSSALAHEDTKSACTANDIEVTGGQIINEPCSCTAGGTFQAIAQFTVINQNNATRKCITLHFSGGGTLGSKDVLLTTDPSGDPTKGSSNIGGLGTSQTMYARLGTVSCNFGRECYPNSVIAFQTAQNQSDTACAGPLMKYPGGQCRRQEICITGFSATLSCASNATCSSTSTANCTVACGGDLYLSATAVGGTSGANGTYSFTVTGPGGTTVASAPAGSSSPQCFTISDPAAGTYTLTATDSKGCTRTASTTVAVNTLAAPVLSGGSPDCDGNVTYTVTNYDSSLTYAFKEVDCSTGAVIRTLGGANASGQLTATFPQDGENHCVVVTASNADGSCPETSNTVTKLIKEPVTFTLNAFVQTDCSGAGSFKAVASGGTSPYTYTFKVNGTQVQSGSSDTLILSAQLDGKCRTIVVSVKDANGCPGTVSAGGTDTRGISQCVVSTACTAA